MIFIGFGVLLSVCTLVTTFLRSIVIRAILRQLRTFVRIKTLSLMFERIEAFFRRLDTYTKVAVNEGMIDTITAIMVEVLNILAIATKGIKQGRLSKSLR